MNPRFQVGEIAIACNVPSPLDSYNGSECEIIAPLRERTCKTLAGLPVVIMCYVVQYRDGQVWATEPHQLRKRFEPGDWAALRDVWLPRRVGA